MIRVSSNTHTGFRTDINGLRAWAVMAVLLFHFNIPGFEAGFIGVDIFFVISGFLMTGIIARGLDHGSFSIRQFYIARFRRIVPAVVALATTLLIISWFWLPTAHYRLLIEESVAALTYTSNIYYWLSTGYFNPSAHGKWLLHTWSLGVEMQFYILFPILALVIWKLGLRSKALFYSLIFICIASLSLSIHASEWQATTTFFLIPTRIWELAVGGLIYFLSNAQLHKNLQRGLFITGLSLLVISFAIIDSTLAWPSGWALFPVIGTALIILAAQKNSLLTGNSIAQWLGNISYSVYLWHWPLVVVLYFANLQNSWAWVILFFALSFLLGELSYRLIETPTRKKLVKLNLPKQALTLLLISLLVGAPIIYIGINHSLLNGRLSDTVELAAAEAANTNPFQRKCYEVSNRTNKPVDCLYSQSEEIGAILIGDSHANSTFTAFGVAGEKHGNSTMYWAKAACPTLKGAKNSKKEPQQGCYQFNKEVFDRLSDKSLDSSKIVFLSRTTWAVLNENKDNLEKQQAPRIYFSKEFKSSNDPAFIKEFEDSLISTACMYKDRNVYLVRPIPEMRANVPMLLTSRLTFGLKEEVKITLDDYHKRHSIVWTAQDKAVERCGAKILNPLPYLCDGKYCYGSKNGRPLYTDSDHLSEYGNSFLIPMFEQVFETQERSD